MWISHEKCWGSVQINDEKYYSVVRVTCEAIGISKGTINTIQNDNMKLYKICVKFMLKIVSKDQLKVCMEILQMTAADHGFLIKVMTCNENWVFTYNFESKHQCSMEAQIHPKAHEGQEVQIMGERYSHPLQHPGDLSHWTGVWELNCQEGLLSQGVRKVEGDDEKLSQGLGKVTGGDDEEIRAMDQWWRVGPQQCSVSQVSAERWMKPISHPPNSPDLVPCNFFPFLPFDGQQEGIWWWKGIIKSIWKDYNRRTRWESSRSVRNTCTSMWL